MDKPVLRRGPKLKPEGIPKYGDTKKMFALYLSSEDIEYLETWGQSSMTGNIKEALELLKKFRPKGL